MYERYLSTDPADAIPNKLESLAIPFRFNIVAAATPETRDQFIADQTAAAESLRAAILADPTATSALQVLASDATTWDDSYLAALEQAGILLPSNTAPPISQSPQVASLMSVLATGILVGPAGSQYKTQADLVTFFTKIHQWYGDKPSTLAPIDHYDVRTDDEGDEVSIPVPALPTEAQYDAGLSAPTSFETFNIFSPLVGFGSNPPLPDLASVNATSDLTPYELSSYLQAVAAQGHDVAITGPQGYGAQQFLPTGYALPYTVSFDNPATASSTASQVRVVTQLDPNLDFHSFRLGDLTIGDINIHIPGSLASFQGDFDFTATKGFILRVSAGIDPQSGAATWLLQAIDPQTGEVLQDATKGLLAPGQTATVSYTVAPNVGVASGTAITANARVLFNTAAAMDAVPLTQTLDTVAPTSTTTVQQLPGSDNYQVSWQSQDDSGGSGVKYATVYVSEDGGNYQIWLSQTSQTTAVYQGQAGHHYTFLTLATDNAGNQEKPPLGIQAPSDGSAVNLGSVTTVQTTVEQTPPPAPSTTPSTNPLFVSSQAGVPAVAPLTNAPEFTSVVTPFSMQSLVTGFANSGAGIGALAVLQMPDGSVLVSGGPDRSWIYKFGHDGGAVSTPWATLNEPIYNLALDNSGNLWATTGGGPLLLLDSAHGNVLGSYGDGITQALAVDSATGLLYVSSGTGIETFDPTSGKFAQFSNVRVDDLQFSPDGHLWGTSWPDRGTVYEFDSHGKATAMLQFNEPIDSLTFGQNGTALQGLLFLSSNVPDGKQTGSTIEMVDLATLQRVTVAQGGTRGEVLRATTDGRVLIALTGQLDVLSPAVAPHVTASTPADGTLVPLPVPTITVTFDHDMYVGDGTQAGSVINPANYTLTRPSGQTTAVQSVQYDAATRTVTLTYAALSADDYVLRVSGAVDSAQGLALGTAYTAGFTTLLNFTDSVQIGFADTRSDRADGTVSFDVTVTNTGTTDLVAPLQLIIDPALYFAGQLQVPFTATSDGLWLIDLSAGLSGGRLAPGQSTTVQTVTLSTAGGERPNLGYGVFAMPVPNVPPVIDSSPVTSATAGTAYQYQLAAHDPDGTVLNYVLLSGPSGMALDPHTGLLSWQPTAATPASTTVVLRVYDGRGGYATQSFAIAVAGGNQAPVVVDPNATYTVSEGGALVVGLSAADPEGDPLIQWADHLPPGASFDPLNNVLTWAPGYTQAGTYSGVTLFVSDGVNTVSRSFTIVVQPANAPPVLTPVASHTVSEGDSLSFALQASDADSTALTFSSPVLPPGATLDPHTGEFIWTPQYTAAGVYSVTFDVTDGTSTVETTTQITVLPTDVAPVFPAFGTYDIAEGQPLSVQLLAIDPSNPGYIPPARGVDGSLRPLEGTNATVTYTVTGLPPGATFDPDTLLLQWTPGAKQAGNYNITVTATGNGNGAGPPLSTTTVIPIVVHTTNHAPQITAIPNQSVNRGAIVNLPISATDPDGNPIAFTVSGLPDFATFVDNGDGTGSFHFAPVTGDRGDYIVTVTATDNGDGLGSSAALSASYSFVVSALSANEPPHFAWTGNSVAVVGQPLTFTLYATDVDQDALTFTASGLPSGATLTPSAIYGQATVQWTPTAADIGTHSVTFTVTDSGNNGQAAPAHDTQTVNLVVRSANQSPVLAPVGDQTVAEGQPLAVQLQAVDPDGDMITYRASGLPGGAVFNPQTGLLSWTPNLFQAGVYAVTFAATDGNATSSETVKFTVTNTNQAPIFTYLPDQSVREGQSLSFTLIAGDPDADAIVYSALTSLPPGVSLDAKTGLVQWVPTYDQAGTYALQFAVTDIHGASSTETITVRVDNVDRPPVIGVQNHAVLLGQTLTVPVIASDPDSNTTLTYSATGLPDGAILNAQTGVLTWTPTPGEAGDHLVNVSVSDGTLTTSAPLLLRALTTPQAPAVTIVMTPNFPAVPGQNVIIHVLASSFGAIATRTLTVNGQTVTLDATGTATLQATAPGQLTLVAAATDVDGFAGSVTQILKIRDPNDTAAPVVSFDPTMANPIVTAPMSIIGSVADSNLDNWVLEIAPQGSDQYVKVAGGTAPLSGPLYQLDSNAWANGVYQLRLTATDITGRVSQTTTLLQIDSTQKSARYLRDDTDASVTLDGHTLDLTREYDSLERNVQGSFGYGWRLPVTNFELTSDVASGSSTTQPFRDGTRVYLTLPTGDRVAFTFEPQLQHSGGLSYYVPTWVADNGVNWTLSSTATQLQRVGDRYYDLTTGQPYNPQAGGAAAAFTVTGPDGTAYSVDPTGHTTQVRFTDGVTWQVSDSGIVAANGDTVSFHTDSTGNIDAVLLPDGSELAYSYDGGNLSFVRNLALAQSTRYGYSSTDTHLLTLATGSLGQGGSSIGYQGAPSAVPLTADLGAATNYLSQTFSGSVSAGGTDRYSIAVRPSELASSPTGVVYLGVVVTAAPGSSLLPALPQIPGMTAIASRVQGNQAFVLYQVNRSGLLEVDVAGTNVTTAGGYTLSFFVAGDANRDGVVDGVDSQALSAAIGTVAGQAGYNPSLDFNDDGRIDATDRELLAQMYGYRANQAPTVTPQSATTHVDLDVAVPVSSFIKDPEGDQTYYRVTGATHGTAKLSGDGQYVIFHPDAGYSGPASFNVVADDGYSQSAVATVAVNISSARLVGLNIGREGFLVQGTSDTLVITGNFADQSNVALPPGYLQFSSSNTSVVTVTPDGVVHAVGAGAAVVQATSHGITVIDSIVVSPSVDEGYLLNTAEAQFDVYPGSVTLLQNTGTRQIVIDGSLGRNDAAAVNGAKYYVQDPTVATVSADGLISAVGVGKTWVTVVMNGIEANIEVEVDAPPAAGAQTVSAADGGVVESGDGLVVQIGPNALPQDTSVSIQSTALNALPIAAPTLAGLTMLGGFQLNVGGEQLAVPVQLGITVPASADLAVGTKVVFYQLSSFIDDQGQTHQFWLLVESGTVGADGVARTASPPLAGIRSGGLYIAAAVPNDSDGSVKIATGVDPALLFNSSANVGMMTSGVDGALMSLAGIADAATTALFGYTFSFGATYRTDIPVPPVGIVDISSIIQPVLSDAPVLSPTVGSVSYDPTSNLVTIFGDELSLADLTAGGAGTLVVRFSTGTGNFVDVTPTSTSLSKITVTPPPHFLLAGSTIQVIATLPSRAPGALPTDTFTLTSNSATVTPRDGLTAVMQAQQIIVMQNGIQLAVINQDDQPQPQPLKLNGWYIDPIAFSADDTRFYVAGQGKIYAIDTATLKVFDTITLPIGTSVSILSLTIAGGDLYAAVGTRSGKGGAGTGGLYRVNVDPSSSAFQSQASVQQIPLGGNVAPFGLYGLAVAGNGRYLLATAPAQAYQLYGGATSAPGNLLLIDLQAFDSPSSTQGPVVRTLSGFSGKVPMFVEATSDPTEFVVTSDKSFNEGFQSVRLTLGANEDFLSAKVESPVSLAPVNYTQDTSWQNIDEAQGVAVTVDGQWGFVADYNLTRETELSADNSGGIADKQIGGKIGVIYQPLGDEPIYLGATSPIFEGSIHSISLSQDGTELYAAIDKWDGSSGLLVYNVQQLIAEANAVRQGSGSPIPGPSTTPLDAGQTLPQFIPTGWVYGVASQAPPTKLILNDSTNKLGVYASSAATTLFQDFKFNDYTTQELSPTFNWGVSVSNYVAGKTNTTATLYLSSYGPKDGLFPTDDSNVPLSVSGLAPAGDLNATRILTLTVQGTYDPTTKMIRFSVDLQNLPKGSFGGQQLYLTASQTYYWGVQYKDSTTGEIKQDSASFTAPSLRVDPSQGFAAVNLMTHGYAPAIDVGAAASATAMYDLASRLAQETGGGVFLYNKQTGQWVPTADEAAAGETTIGSFLGKPIFLVSDWIAESGVTTTGFAEAAADELFASLVQLDNSVGHLLFKSPLQLIGHSRGTVVNSEVAQRLGYYGITPPDLQMTSLDVHDFDQPSLNLLSLPEEDFADPDVVAWDNIQFADNYYEDLVPVATGLHLNPDGRSLIDPAHEPPGGALTSDANIDLNLDNLPGFPGSDTATGGPHSRTQTWYVGTADLAATQALNSEYPIFRGLQSYNVYGTSDLAPWYVSGLTNKSNSTAKTSVSQLVPTSPNIAGQSTEGVEEGWFFSVLGGGYLERPARTTHVNPDPKTFDNSDTGSETKSPLLNPTFIALANSQGVVPSVDDGNFQASANPLYNRYLPTFDVPGWSAVTLHPAQSIPATQTTPAVPTTATTAQFLDLKPRVSLSAFATQVRTTFQTLPSVPAAVITTLQQTLTSTMSSLDSVLASLYSTIQAQAINELASNATMFTRGLGGVIFQAGNEIPFDLQKLQGFMPSTVANTAAKGSLIDTGAIVAQLATQLNISSGNVVQMLITTLHLDFSSNAALMQSVLDQYYWSGTQNQAYSLSANNGFTVTHNPLYIPPTATQIAFDWSTQSTQPVVFTISLLGGADGNQLLAPVIVGTGFPSSESADDGYAHITMSIPTSWLGLGGRLQINASLSPLSVDLGDDVRIDNVTLTPTPPAPLVQADTAASVGNSTGPGITQADVQQLAAAAEAEWVAAGADPSSFAGLQFVVSDLPGTEIAETQGQTITIDVNAAGNGWFVDPTPTSNEEFISSGEPLELDAVAGSTAASEFDLLTVMAHEMGHVLGYEHSASTDTSDPLMHATLSAGVRRLPTPIQTQASGDSAAGGSNVSGGSGTSTSSGSSTATPVVSVTPQLPTSSTSQFEQATHTGVDNGDFGITDPTSDRYGWTTSGNVSFVNGTADLQEGDRSLTDLSQAFVLPTGVTALRFTIDAAQFAANGLAPPDAFEVALLNSVNGTPVVGTVSLSHSDALLNLQSDGTLSTAAGVSVSGLPTVANGSLLDTTSPITVTIDLSHVAAGTSLQLYLDLLGLGAKGSQVVIENVRLLTSSSGNLPPVANNDTASTGANTAVQVAVLANDTDPEGAALSAVLVSGASHGTVTLGSNGVFTYTPNRGFSGTDHFTYVASDGQTESNVATVTVNVSAPLPPIANDDTGSTPEQTAVRINVLSNDTDSYGFPLSPTIVTGPAHGTVVANSDGTFTYTPTGTFYGTDHFTYQVSDGEASSNVATVTISVSQVIHAPVATDDSARTVAGIPINIAVLANDVDVDGNPLTPIIVSSTTNGTVTVNADGTIQYTPNSGFIGTDQFTYQDNDGNGLSNVATVSITVDAHVPPTAVAGTVSTPENTPYVFKWSDFQISEPGVPTLYVNVNPLDCYSGGQLEVLGADGNWSDVTSCVVLSSTDVDAGKLRFVPAEDETGFGGYVGAGIGNMEPVYATFTYTAYDGEVASDPVTMSIDVIPVATAPTLTISGQDTNVDLYSVTTTWESVGNPDSNATLVSQPTLEGWTAVGTSGFTVWSGGDVQTASDGSTDTLYKGWSPGNNFVELAGGTGIERTVNTVAGVQYTLYYDFASELLDSSGSITVSVDGQAQHSCDPTSQSSTSLDWRQGKVTFIGTGGTQTIQLMSGSKGVMLGNLGLAQEPVNTGYENSPIHLQRIDSALVDNGGSQTLSLTVGGLPVGAVLTDGTNSFTATADQNSVDITNWTGWNLSLTPPPDFYGTIALTVRATSTVTSNGAAASVTQSLPVTVLADPVALSSTVTTPENTPYVFQWSDFKVSDPQSTALSVDLSTWCQGGGHLEYLTSDGWEAEYNNLLVSKADIDAGKLRFVPDEDATGYSGYGGTGVGNLQATYSLFTYSAFDGGMVTDAVTMNIDVLPVATAPTLTISGQDTNVDLYSVITTWETVGNPDSNATVVSQPALEGWAAVGASGFKVWSNGDVQTASDGTAYTIGKGSNPSGNFVELAGGTGIERTVNTVAGVQYTLTYDFAGELLDSSGSITVSVDGQALPGCEPASQSGTSLDWQQGRVTFIGTGGPQTIQLMSGLKGVMLGNLGLAQEPVNTGYENSPIHLQRIDSALVDNGGSQTLSLTVEGLPVGAVLTDGTNSFTATAGQNSVDITNWAGWNISLIPPTDFYGTIALTVRATSTVTSSGAAASVTRSLPVTVLADPVAQTSTVTTPENTPYVFQWSDFKISDAQTTALSVDLSTWCQGGGHLEYLTSDGWEAEYNNLLMSKADIDAGKLRFVPDEDATGYSGYGGTGLGNLQATYSLFTYSAFDGGMDSDPVTMSIDVTPVAIAPTLTISGQDTNVNLYSVSTTWETVSNPDSNATLVSQPTLEGWTAVGASGFKVWSQDDVQTDSEGTADTLYKVLGPGANFVELAGSTGIERTVNTVAGVQYTLYYNFASELLDSSGSIIVSVDGQALPASPLTSQSGTSLNWQEAGVSFIGTGGTQTIQLMSGSKGVMLGNLGLARQPVNTGYENNAILLQRIDSALADWGGSQALSLTVAGLPVGAVLTDGTNSFTATADQNSVDITNWTGWNLSLTPPTDFYGTIALTVRATSTVTSTGAAASVTQSLPVTVLAAPVAQTSTVTTSENTPYVFQWSDFHISDAQSTALAVDMSAWCQGGGHLEYLTSDGWRAETYSLYLTKADIDAGKLRFVPDPDATGYSGYGGTGLGNLQSTYTLFMYSGSDGGMETDPVAMNIDVTPVATAPTLTVSGQTSNVALNVLRTTWETVGNPDTNATQLSQPALEGWTAVGTPGFTVWSVGDVQTDSAGTADTLYKGSSPGSNFVELPGGTGIARTVNTVAGMQYTLTYDYASELLDGSGSITVSVDGQALSGCPSTSQSDTGLDWREASVSFVGTGGPQTIQLTSGAKGVMLGDLWLAEQPVNTGYQDTAIRLQPIDAELVDRGGSENLSLTVAGLPVGAVLTDGTNSFTATADQSSVDITDWWGGNLSLTPPSGFYGTVSLTLTATATAPSNGSTASVTQSLPVTVLAAPTAVASTVTTPENTPYVFQWSDFQVSDAQTQGTPLAVDMSTWCQGGGHLEFLTTDGWETEINSLTVTKADVDAGKLRFVPDQDATGYSGYGGTGLGNLQSTYTLFTYSAFDGGMFSDPVTMNIDVTPVATAPTLTVSGQTSSVSLNVLRTTWETVGNPDTNAMQLLQPTLEGWTAVGTSGFTVWSVGDVQADSAGTVDTLYKGSNPGSNFVELPGGTGIARTVNTVAGMQYTLTYDYASELLDSSGSITVSVDGQALSGCPSTSQSDTGLDWREASVSFVGTGGPQTIQLTSGAKGVMLGDLWLAEQPVNTGYQDTAIRLQPIDAELVDRGGSENLSLTVAGLPVGAVLTGGTNSFTATADQSSVDITDWWGGNLSLTPPSSFYGTISLTLTATATAPSNGSTASVTQSLPVTVLAAPTAVASTVTTPENTPYVFQWSDFQVSDAQTQGTPLAVDMSTWCQGGGHLEFLTTDGWETEINSLTVTKADVDAGKLRFVPDPDATGFSGYGGTDLGNLQSTYTLFTYSAFDGGMFSNPVAMNIDVIPVATAPTITLDGGGSPVNTGYENTSIQLQQIDGELVDRGGSETLSVTIEGLPVGAVLTDGTNTFTATAGLTTADVTNWSTGCLSITPPTDFYGTIPLTVRATSTAPSNGSTASVTQAITVTVEQGSYTSPLVIDLTGQGIRTVGLSMTGGTFDLLDTGRAIHSGWIASGNAFLAVDTNGNGTIDNRSELFGGEEGQGFAELAKFDTNGDGVINAADQDFGKLLIWQDLNGDHRSEPGELMSLSQAGIVSISLHDTVEPQLQNGNRILERSVVTMGDGRTLPMADVYFETDAAEAAQAQAQSDAVPVALVPPPAKHQASITVQSLLNARDPIVAPVRRASVTSGRVQRPPEASPTPTPQRILPDIDLRQPWDQAAAIPSAEAPTSTPVIDWSRRGAPLTERFPEIPVHAPWAVDFLGVNTSPQRDLGRLTGLSMRIPETPNRANSV